MTQKTGASTKKGDVGVRVVKPGGRGLKKNAKGGGGKRRVAMEDFCAHRSGFSDLMYKASITSTGDLDKQTQTTRKRSF